VPAMRARPRSLRWRRDRSTTWSPGLTSSTPAGKRHDSATAGTSMP